MLLASFPEPIRKGILQGAGSDYRGDRDDIPAMSAAHRANRELESWTEYYPGLRLREA